MAGIEFILIWAAVLIGFGLVYHINRVNARRDWRLEMMQLFDSLDAECEKMQTEEDVVRVVTHCAALLEGVINNKLPDIEQDELTEKMRKIVVRAKEIAPSIGEKNVPS